MRNLRDSPSAAFLPRRKGRNLYSLLRHGTRDDRRLSPRLRISASKPASTTPCYPWMRIRFPISDIQISRKDLEANEELLIFLIRTLVSSTLTTPARWTSTRGRRSMPSFERIGLSKAAFYYESVPRTNWRPISIVRYSKASSEFRAEESQRYRYLEDPGCARLGAAGLFAANRTGPQQRPAQRPRLSRRAASTITAFLSPKRRPRVVIDSALKGRLLESGRSGRRVFCPC